MKPLQRVCECKRRRGFPKHEGGMTASPEFWSGKGDRLRVSFEKEAWASQERKRGSKDWLLPW